MGIKRDSLSVLLNRTYNNYISQLKPTDKIPRYNLIKVLSSVDSGIYHQLLGDLSFLSNQMFPDTATGEYLRAHWSDRVPPLYATAATGNLKLTGSPGAIASTGIVFSSNAGNRYYTRKPYQLDSTGSALALVTSEKSGTDVNLTPGTKLSLISSIPKGIDSAAEVDEYGIIGGVNAETDEIYLTRVLRTLQRAEPYGRIGDFVTWAIDSSPAVTNAFEIKNFSVFGSLLIQVINGNQTDGLIEISPQAIKEVTQYINAQAPPVLFEVRTPEIKKFGMKIHIIEDDSTEEKHELIKQRLRIYLDAYAYPGCSFTEAILETAFVDGIDISVGKVVLDGGIISTTVLEYPFFDEALLEWEFTTS